MGGITDFSACVLLLYLLYYFNIDDSEITKFPENSNMFVLFDWENFPIRLALAATHIEKIVAFLWLLS
jgi:hypothetical protein